MKKLQRVAGLNPMAIGCVLVVTMLVAGMALFQKQKIINALTRGDVVKVEFSREYRLVPYISKVKIAGVPVGVVNKVESGTDGRSEVELKLDKGVVGRLGKSPSAAIRPTTVLGGSYYVEVRPAGDPGSPRGTIPLARTTVPVELDRVLSTLQPDARAGLQKTFTQLDSTLINGGEEAVKRLVKSAPAALAPSQVVLKATLGTRPEQDLTDLVSGLENTARVLTERNGEFDSIVGDLSRTSQILNEQRVPSSEVVRDLPSSMRTAREGLAALTHTLGEVEKTADDARPSAKALSVLLDHARPVLAEARPLLRDLRPTLRDATHLVQGLVPSARLGTQALNDVNGRVLDRVNGPVLKTVMSPYQGSGPYKYTSGKNPLYKEIAYMFAGLDNASKMTDKNGASIGFQPGIGTGTLGGLPLSFEQLFAALVLGGKTS